MKPIDGEAAVWMLREHDMYEAAELIKAMPRIEIRKTPVSCVIEDFLASNERQIELDTSAYAEPHNCYITYRAALKRYGINDCYVFKKHGRIYLARL